VTRLPAARVDLDGCLNQTNDYLVKMTNDTYCVVLRGKRTKERYYRDRHGWLKISNRGREFRATPEQVLNHLLPALAFGEQLGLSVTVEHYDTPYWETVASGEGARDQPA
jgi:hypothetical protein